MSPFQEDKQAEDLSSKVERVCRTAKKKSPMALTVCNGLDRADVSSLGE